MNTPESMKADLAAWNTGQGIDLESWIGCVGNFSLAVGYLSVFCPEFVEFEGYILRDGFSEDSLRGFEKSCAGNRKAIEAVMNHLLSSGVNPTLLNPSPSATNNGLIFLCQQNLVSFNYF